MPATKKQSGETLSDRARRRREELGISKTELARRISDLGRPCAIQNIRQLELGDVRNITYLGELARALETDAVWLQTGTHQMAPVDAKIMAAAWKAANVIVEEHSLKYSDEQRMDLAVRIYQEIVAHHSPPAEAAKSALLHLLAARHRR